MAIFAAPLRARIPCRSFGRLPAACAILFAISVAGCARNTAQRETSPPPREARAPAPVRVVVRPRPQPRTVTLAAQPLPYPAPRVRRPDAALMSPQPAPDCDFDRPDLKTVDPEQWARLKAEFERQCYRDAEKAARERLTTLQASATCEIEPVRQATPVR